MNILELFTSWGPNSTDGVGICDGVGLHRLAGCLGLALHLGIILLRALACLFPWRKLSRDAVERLSKQTISRYRPVHIDSPVSLQKVGQSST